MKRKRRSGKKPYWLPQMLGWSALGSAAAAIPGLAIRNRQVKTWGVIAGGLAGGAYGIWGRSAFPPKGLAITMTLAWFAAGGFALANMLGWYTQPSTQTVVGELSGAGGTGAGTLFPGHYGISGYPVDNRRAT